MNRNPKTFNNVIVDSCVSSGTLRTQDLLRNFADELDRLNPFNCFHLIAEAKELAGKLNGDNSDDYNEAAGEVLAELTRNLEGLAPENTCFGAHEGDGADFGFWSYDDE